MCTPTQSETTTSAGFNVIHCTHANTLIPIYNIRLWEQMRRVGHFKPQHVRAGASVRKK